jgi:prepilin peptidase CpaA
LSLPVWGPLAILVALCGAAAWLDLTQRRIPNWLCGLTAVTGLATVAASGSLGDLGSHALHMALALLGGVALFALGGFGGGDAKFYAGAAAWFALGQALLLLLCVALSGLLLLVGWFVYRRMRGIPVRRSNHGPFDGLPYGMAIAGGAVAAMVV